MKPTSFKSLLASVMFASGTLNFVSSANIYSANEVNNTSLSNDPLIHAIVPMSTLSKLIESKEILSLNQKPTTAENGIISISASKIPSDFLHINPDIKKIKELNINSLDKNSPSNVPIMSGHDSGLSTSEIPGLNNQIHNSNETKNSATQVLVDEKETLNGLPQINNLTTSDSDSNSSNAVDLKKNVEQSSLKLNNPIIETNPNASNDNKYLDEILKETEQSSKLINNGLVLNDSNSNNDKASSISGIKNNVSSIEIDSIIAPSKVSANVLNNRNSVNEMGAADIFGGLNDLSNSKSSTDHSEIIDLKNKFPNNSNNSETIIPLDSKLNFLMQTSGNENTAENKNDCVCDNKKLPIIDQNDKKEDKSNSKTENIIQSAEKDSNLQSNTNNVGTVVIKSQLESEKISNEPQKGPLSTLLTTAELESRKKQDAGLNANLQSNIENRINQLDDSLSSSSIQSDAKSATALNGFDQTSVKVGESENAKKESSINEKFKI